MSHFIKKCRACGTVIAQCRCPSKDKAIEWGECKRYPECGQHSTADERQPDINYRQMAVDLTAERDALKAENERLRARLWAKDQGWAEEQRTLRELRKAAEALGQYITEMEDAEWLAFSCLDMNHEAVKRFRAVLAKVPR
jgi:glycine/D-amino acid oxidase-like deaminating enzyme